MISLAEPAIVGRLKRVRLPAIPQVLSQLLEMCRQDAVGAAELAALIKRDPALTARILSVASSPPYRRGHATLNVEKSLLAIGTNMVKTLLISEAVFHAFEGLSPDSALDLSHFWEHALSTAVTAQEVAGQMGYPRSEEAYLAGLLHDVGRLALLSAAPSEYARHFYAQDDEALCASEKLILGVTHAEAGAWIAEQWQVDSFIADSIRYHHEPEAKLHSTHPLLRITALANQLACRPQTDARLMAAASICGLKYEHLEAVERRARKEVEKVAEYVGIDIADVDRDSTRFAAPPLVRDSARASISMLMQNKVLASELARCFSGLEEETSVPAAILRSACILFDLTDALMLTVSKGDRTLKPVVADDLAGRLSEFSIPLNAPGPVTDALLRKQVTYQAQHDPDANIFAEQLQRLLGGSVLVTIPIAEEEMYSGVLVASTDNEHLKDLRKRDEVLRIFGEQAHKAMRDAASGPAQSASASADALLAEYQSAARTIAHEVNNPLSIIRNYLTVLDRKISQKEPVEAEISILQEEIDRVGALVESFAELRPVSQTNSAAVGEAIADVVNLLRDSEFAPPTVRITVKSMDAALHVSCDHGTLKQIFLNLLKNAVEALPGQGTIDITNNGFTSKDSRLYVSISIKDNGPGIPAEVMARLFSPVRTQKGEAHKGLGLSIVNSLVTKINGQIFCRSGIDGTTFELLLPLSPHSGKVRAPMR